MNTVELGEYFDQRHELAGQSFNQHQWSNLADNYSEDATIIRGNGNLVQGRQAIALFFSDFSTAQDASFNVLSRDVSGDICCERLEYSFKGAPDTNPVIVQALEVSMLQSNGDWKLKNVSFSLPRESLH